MRGKTVILLLLIVHYELLPVCKFPRADPAEDTRKELFRHGTKMPGAGCRRPVKVLERGLLTLAPLYNDPVKNQAKPTVAQSRAIVAAALLLAMTSLPGCRHQGPPVESEGPDSLGLTSPSFQEGRIPAAFTCDGANTSPVLRWNAPPAATKSLALILNDRDPPMGSFVHWVLYNLPPTTQSLPESVPALDQLPNGARQGRNDFGNIGYGGPCPGHSDHRYVFMVFALDSTLNLPSGATRDQLDDAMKGHVLARGTLTAKFHRQ